MREPATAIRWFVAILAAILAFAIGLAAQGFAYKGSGPSAFQTWVVATLLAAFTGILIAPPRHRNTARYIFIAGPVAVSVVLLLDSLFGHIFEATNELEAVAGSMTGGLIAWRINRGRWRP